jgi:hypothetical protein
LRRLTGTRKKDCLSISSWILSIYAKIAVQFEKSIQIGGFVVAFSVSFVCAKIAVPRTAGVLQTAWLDI